MSVQKEKCVKHPLHFVVSYSFQLSYFTDSVSQSFFFFFLTLKMKNVAFFLQKQKIWKFFSSLNF